MAICCKYIIFIDLVITGQWKAEKQKRGLVHLLCPLYPSMKVVIPVNSLTSLLLPELLELCLTTSTSITELSVTWIAQADQNCWREVSTFSFTLPREQVGMQSLNELQCHIFKITWVTWELWSASVTVLVLLQWSCIQLCIYLFLCLYNPLTSNCTTKALRRTETLFWHRMPQRARKVGRVLQRCALSALQYLDPRQHHLLQEIILSQSFIWNKVFRGP